MTNQNECVRHHLIVPASDTIVEEWIKAQRNVSASLRTLIKWCVAKRGMTDIMCIADIGASIFGLNIVNAVQDDVEINNCVKGETNEEAASNVVTNNGTINTSVSDADETTNNIANDIMKSLLD